MVSGRKRSYEIIGDKKIVPLSRQAIEGIEGLKEMFMKKFGREPGRDDPLMFDPTSDTPKPMSEAQMQGIQDDLAEIAKEAGINPALVYAMRKTGRIVSDGNMEYLTDEELQEWNDAIAEYKELL